MAAGIFNAGTLTIADCTIAGSSATSGSGIYNSSSGTLVLTGDGTASLTVTGDVVNDGTIDLEECGLAVSGTLLNESAGTIVGVDSDGDEDVLLVAGTLDNLGTIRRQRGSHAGKRIERQCGPRVHELGNNRD